MVRRAFAFDFNVVNTTDKILNALRAEFDELFVCEWAFFLLMIAVIFIITCRQMQTIYTEENIKPNVQNRQNVNTTGLFDLAQILYRV